MQYTLMCSWNSNAYRKQSPEKIMCECESVSVYSVCPKAQQRFYSVVPSKYHQVMFTTEAQKLFFYE